MNNEVKNMIEKHQEEIELKKVLQEMINTEQFAVLCTQGDNQPYGSVISYAISDDLKYLVFATSINTRKYDLIINCERVAVVFDNRSKFKDDVSKLSAITMTGNARPIKDKKENKSWSELLIKKHPFIIEFLNNTDTSIIVIESKQYQYVSEFQKVYYWKP